MGNKAHIKIDKVVEYCSECPFCSIKCTGYGKSGCYEHDVICHAIDTKFIYTNLRFVDIFQKSDSDCAKDFVPDDCPMKIEDEIIDSKELEFESDNDELFSKTMERYAKFAANDPEFFEYFLKLQRFQYEHCEPCGTQRCLGVYDKDWREGCILYLEEFDSEKDYTDVIDYAIQFLEWVKRDTDRDMWLRMIYDVYNTDNKVTLEELVQEYFECNCANPDQWDNAFKGVTKAVYYIGANNLSDIENNINNF